MTNTKQLIEGLHLEDITAEEIDVLATKWGMSTLDLLNTLNDIGNNYPATIEGIIKSLHKFTDEAVQEGLTIKQSIGLVVSLRETRETYEAVGNAIKNFIQRVGNIEDIKNAEIEEFGAYHLARASFLKSQLSDVNSYYYQIA